MKHTTLDQLKTVAEIEPGHLDPAHLDPAQRDPTQLRPAMTHEQRLERWAEILDKAPDRLLATLPGTEYQPIRKRDTMRGDNSAITVAFHDPILRGEGMKDDTYGEAKRFFDITDWQLHEVVCYCHFGATLKAGTAARHVRTILAQQGPGVFTRLRDALVW